MFLLSFSLASMVIYVSTWYCRFHGGFTFANPLTIFGKCVLLLLQLDNEGFLDRDYFGRLDRTLVTLFQMSMYFS